ncbi:MAG: AzlC family ABC transporter permease [Clostridiales Family XIII bacterium]|nr:AzlC family ABC transporter permease [Clostridiales Family XIII bacterium]
MKNAMKAAFPVTIPILLGYVPLGVAFGLMLENAGYGLIWAVASSVAMYTGTGQFLEVRFLDAAAPLLEIALLTFVLNSRMLFYGLSFINKFGSAGKWKWYLIFALTDETYALLCAVKCPESVDEKTFMLAVSFLNQCYWVAGGVIGVLAGSLIAIDTTGIDFIMPALFIVLAMDQWKAYPSRLPAVIGLACSVLLLMALGPGHFMIPALLVMMLALLAARRRIEKTGRNDDS